MTAPAPTRAEEAREADCASEWRQIERAWRDADLPEWFLGNGGTNHGLYRFVDKVRALNAARAEAEVARLTAAVAISEVAVRSLRARVAVLEAALKPFAEAIERADSNHAESYGEHNPPYADDQPIDPILPSGETPELCKLGDFRAARAALHGGENDR